MFAWSPASFMVAYAGPNAPVFVLREGGAGVSPMTTVETGLRMCSHLRNGFQKCYAEWQGKRICFDCILALPGVEKYGHPLNHVYTLERWRPK